MPTEEQNIFHMILNQLGFLHMPGVLIDDVTAELNKNLETKLNIWMNYFYVSFIKILNLKLQICKIFKLNLSNV